MSVLSLGMAVKKPAIAHTYFFDSGNREGFEAAADEYRAQGVWLREVKDRQAADFVVKTGYAGGRWAGAFNWNYKLKLYLDWYPRQDKCVYMHEIGHYLWGVELHVDWVPSIMDTQLWENPCYLTEYDLAQL